MASSGFILLVFNDLMECVLRLHIIYVSREILEIVLDRVYLVFHILLLSIRNYFSMNLQKQETRDYMDSQITICKFHFYSTKL